MKPHAVQVWPSVRRSAQKRRASLPRRNSRIKSAGGSLNGLLWVINDVSEPSALRPFLTQSQTSDMAIATAEKCQKATSIPKP